MSDFNSFVTKYNDSKRDYAILKLAVSEENPELLEIYKTHIEKHNDSVLHDPFPNSGFDIFVPKDTTVNTSEKSVMIHHDIKCEMINPNGHSCAYYMYPRSSISKTPLMLANHVGVIDSGYRGTLIGAFRSLTLHNYIVEKHSRLLQITHPSLCPIFVELVNESQLSNTSRGEGGFGSTGK
jgi:dUTP pyrophosphatase